MINAKDFDAVIMASGGEPIIPKIHGADGDNIWNIANVFDNEKKLGKNVVLIGAGEFGAGTGAYLAQMGHNVTVLASGRELVERAGPHQIEIMLEAITHLENFSYVTGAVATSISNGKVTYTDANGNEKSVKADDVVIWAGLKSRKDKAMKFYGSAPRFFVVGDCRKVGDLHSSNRTAFGAASQI
jgi:pyruvate/2-oxoglutarate dehydrogenase complex dihydrolipoamide dehydrogenase (E3) component